MKKWVKISSIYSKITKLHPMFRDFSAKPYPMFRDFFCEKVTHFSGTPPFTILGEYPPSPGRSVTAAAITVLQALWGRAANEFEPRASCQGHWKCRWPRRKWRWNATTYIYWQHINRKISWVSSVVEFTKWSWGRGWFNGIFFFLIWFDFCTFALKTCMRMNSNNNNNKNINNKNNNISQNRGG